MNYLISGGASPLGRKLCSTLLAEGCGVTLIVRDAQKLKIENSTTDTLPQIIECNLSDAESVELLCNKITKFKGSFWAFIHLAATSQEDNFEITKMSNSFSVNVFSGWQIADTCIGNMETAGGGRIVFVGSVGHRFGGKTDRPAYSGSKFLLEYFPRRFRECAKNNVLVNTLRLGVMLGGTQEKMGVHQNQLANRVSLIPTKKFIDHEEAVGNILALSRPSNMSTHNSIISCTGGE